MADDIRTAEVDAIGALAANAQRMSMRQRLLTGLAGFVVLLLVGVGLYWFLVASRYVSTDNAYVGASTAQISAQVSGLVQQSPVGETQSVHAGDLLVVINPEDAQLAVERARADYQRTLQRVRQYFAQDEGAAAQVAARQADLDRAQADYARRNQLASTGAVAAEELTSARSDLASARANLAAARQALASQRALTQGSTPENHPETLAAKAALDAAELDLARTRISAPIDGIVVQNHVAIGQKVEFGTPLMAIAPIGRAYVDANFKESQLRQMRIGQPVTLKSDLYGDSVEYHGHITGLGGGTGSAFAVIPAQNATGNWIKVVQRVPVRIQLDPRELAAHPLRVGLSMSATVDIRDPGLDIRGH